MKDQLPGQDCSVNVLLEKDEVYVQVLEFLQSIYQRLSRSREAIIAPHQHHVDCSFSSSLQHKPILSAFLTHARRLVNVFTSQDKLTTNFQDQTFSQRVRLVSRNPERETVH